MRLAGNTAQLKAKLTQKEGKYLRSIMYGGRPVLVAPIILSRVQQATSDLSARLKSTLCEAVRRL